MLPSVVAGGGGGGGGGTDRMLPNVLTRVS